MAKKAIERRTGARGLRSIMEGILLDTMFDLPGLDGVEQVVIGPEVVEGKARPLYIYSERGRREERRQRLRCACGIRTRLGVLRGSLRLE